MTRLIFRRVISRYCLNIKHFPRMLTFSRRQVLPDRNDDILQLVVCRRERVALFRVTGFEALLQPAGALCGGAVIE